VRRQSEAATALWSKSHKKKLMIRKNESKAAGNSHIPGRFGAQEAKAPSPLRSAGALQKSNYSRRAFLASAIVAPMVISNLMTAKAADPNS